MSVKQANWKCPNCGITAGIRLFPVHCSCGYVDYGDGSKVAEYNYGPGTELKKLISEIFPNVSPCSACSDYASLMNAWGVHGCRLRLDEITTRLRNNLVGISIVDFVIGVARSLNITFSAIKNPTDIVNTAIRLIVEEAINRSEKKLISIPKFIKTSELVDLVYSRSVLGSLSKDVDLVVGVARSGLLPASIIALNNHLPLLSCDLKNNRLTESGYGYRSRDFIINPKHVLVVEDSIMNGHSIKQAIHITKENFPDAKITDLALYVNPRQSYRPSIIGMFAHPPHFFEWNFFNSVFVPQTAFDFDGIFCYDVTTGNSYNSVDERPLYLPRFATVPLIVTGRPYHMRNETETWLKNHNISYKELVMWPASEEERKKDKAISAFKADVYSKRPDIKIFVESCPIQAREIYKMSNKLVICPSTGDVFGYYDSPT